MAPRAERPIKQTIRRHQLREIVPLADSTIYEMEQRGELRANW
jgi:prophage regulatory protein